MPDNVTIPYEALKSLATFVEQINNVQPMTKSVDRDYVNPFAAWLLSKADHPVVTKRGNILSKSAIDEMTLDFTATRSLTEEIAEETIRFIYDKSPYLQMFNSGVVNKLVVPVNGRVITRKNLISNEQKGSAVSNINTRIVHTFGINLYLKNINLRKDIALQTVVNNLYNPNFYADTMNDVAVALSNDILLLVTNGLEYASYSSSSNFYDLNMGFVRILQQADGANTNTYGSIKIYGTAAKNLTPQKINAVGATGVNYTATNLLNLMRKMYKAMPMEYRNDPSNVWMMSRVDADLYMDSRSDMTSPSNTTREMTLTSGFVPNFMGHRIVVLPDLYGIDELHEYSASSVKGALIFGNPKNIDVKMSSQDIFTSTNFNARGDAGAAYQYDFNGYLDVHVAKPDSFVIAYSGATCSTPYLVSESGTSTLTSGKITESSTNTYNNSGSNLVCSAYCDNSNAVLFKHTSSMASMTYAQALAAATIVAQGELLTLSADTYFKAYNINGDLTASTEIMFDKAL